MKIYLYIFTMFFITMTVAVPAQADRLSATGKLTFLRVNDVETGFGPANDHINVEVVIKLDSRPGEAAFGFKLRDDGNRPAHQGMLDLLRDAFNHGWIVTIKYDIETNKKKGEILRVELTKPQGPVVGGNGTFSPN